MKFNEKYSNIIFLGLLIIAILFFGFVVEIVGWGKLFWVILIITGIFFTFHIIKKIKSVKFKLNKKFLEENKYAIQGYVFLGSIIYILLISISVFFDIGKNIIGWSFLGILVTSTLFAIIQTLEKSRIENQTKIIKNLNLMSNPKILEITKFTFGIILLLFPVAGGIIFFFEGMGSSSYILDYYSINDTIFSNDTPIFLGLCGIGGAILLNSVKIDSIK